MAEMGRTSYLKKSSSWSSIFRLRGRVCLFVILGAALLVETLFVAPVMAQTAASAASAGLPSETPATFTPVTTSFDYIKRDVMIPMRDGVKLHTVIVVPRARRARQSCSRAPLTMPRHKSAMPKVPILARS